MEILVLVKEVPDFNVRVEIEPRTFRVDPEDLIFSPNPCDLASLCHAIKLIQDLEAGSVTVILMGPRRAERTLRKCLDYGALRAIHLLCENISELESHEIAFILAEIIRRMSLAYDLILSGHDRSGAGFATGQIGAQVAAHLGLPQVSQVSRIWPDSGQKNLMVQCALDRGDRVTLRCSPPMLLTIHLDLEKIAYPSLSTSLDSLNTQVEQVNLQDLIPNTLAMEKRTSLLGVSSPRPRPKKVFTPASTLSAAERIRLIMTGGLTKKKSEFIEGSPEELSKYIMDFLVKNRLIDLESVEQ